MKIKCYSVKLKSLIRISDKCFKAESYNGAEALIPASQYFGQDYDSTKSEAHYISAWILEKKNLQYSTKKERWFYNDSKKMAPVYHFEKHVPEKINKKVEIDATLIR